MNPAKSRRTLPLLFFLIALLPCIVQGAEIRVSAAASMNDTVKELAALYNEQHPDISIQTNLGGSGALAKQIAQGAPADLFISANVKWMDYLVSEGKIARESVRVVARNTLVFVGWPKFAAPSLQALPSLSRIAIGSPRSVPAGQYAKQAMDYAGIYEKLATQNKLAMAKDVRQALLYAERGEVDGAFVYKSDALLAKQTVILFTVPENLHDPIVYSMGLTLDGRNNAAAQSFSDFLATPAALAVLEKFGFSPPPPPATPHN